MRSVRYAQKQDDTEIEVGTRLYVAPGTSVTSAISGKTFRLSVNRVLGLDYDNLLEEGKVYRVVKRENGLYLCPVGMSVITEADLMDVLIETEIVEGPRYSNDKEQKEVLRQKFMRHVSEVNLHFLNVCIITRSLLEEIAAVYLKKESDYSVKRVIKNFREGNARVQAILDAVEVKMKRNIVEEARDKNG